MEDGTCGNGEGLGDCTCGNVLGIWGKGVETDGGKGIVVDEGTCGKAVEEEGTWGKGVDCGKPEELGNDVVAFGFGGNPPIIEG